jgi:hypothetical protein
MCGAKDTVEAVGRHVEEHGRQRGSIPGRTARS